MSVKVGIIGGTGLSNLDFLTDRQEWHVETPFGKPTDALVQGKIQGVDCVILRRHGRRYNIMPSNINYRANVWALREAGCTHILSATACGSLQDKISAGDFVLPDQFIDLTTKRSTTFYDGASASPDGMCFLPMHTPFCKYTKDLLLETAQELGIRCFPSGTIITVEGPRFSTTSETNLYRSWGAHLINMTTCPEVVLAREAGMSYVTIAMVTDGVVVGDEVSVEGVTQRMKENAEKISSLISNAVPKMVARDWRSVIDGNKELVLSNTILHN